MDEVKSAHMTKELAKLKDLNIEDSKGLNVSRGRSRSRRNWKGEHSSLSPSVRGLINESINFSFIIRTVMSRRIILKKEIMVVLSFMLWLPRVKKVMRVFVY